LKKIQKKIIDLLPILQIFQELAHLHLYINEKSRENNFIKNLPSYKIGKNLQKKKRIGQPLFIVVLTDKHTYKHMMQPHFS